MYNTLSIILEQALMHLPLICGAYISISLMKQPDLSINSAYLMGAIFGAKTPFMFGIIGSCFGGLLVGLTTSLIAKKGKIPYLLASIISIGLFHGFSLFILGSSYMSIGQSYTASANTVVAICALAVVAFLYLFLKTQLGYSLAVYGNNSKFFEHHNINSGFVLISGICISHILAGIGGYLFTLSNGFVEVGMGTDIALLCITGIILGKIVCRSNKPINFLVPIVGTFVYFTIQQLLLKTGFDLKYFTLVQSVIVLAAVLYFFNQKANQTNLQNDNLGV
jgi:putative ABC transport system permease protein